MPNETLEGLGTRSPGVRPTPEKPIVTVGFDPFDETVSEPLAPPAEAGSKVTVNEVLCPALKV